MKFQTTTNSIAKNSYYSFLLIVPLSLLLNIGIAFFQGIPAPAIHDEFAYLLTGDTFANFRITNPTPLFKEHFQTYQIFFEPTYQAKYPPGQGFILSIAILLFNEPIIGVWLSLALGCYAIFWMNSSIIPEKWSFLGALIITTNPNIIKKFVFSLFQT